MPFSREAGRWIAASAVGFALAGDPAVAATTNERAIGSIDSCIRAVFSLEAAPALRGRIDLERLCPDLASDLKADGLPAPGLAWAADNLSEDLSTAELLDLRVLVAPAAGGAKLHWTQSHAQLSDLLQEVLVMDDAQAQRAWWERILEWLRELIDRQGDADFGWLEEALSSLAMSDEMAKRILYGVTALLILFLVALVAHELRAAGLFRNRRKRAAGRDGDALETSPSARRSKLSLSSIRDLARQRQPAAILRLCIQELVARGRLPDDYSRTNRELYCSLGQSGEEAVSFGELVRLAENASYGKQQVTDQVLVRCYVGAEHILGAR